ncbi:hypothetical protein [Streptosporangium sandarakinum]
MSGGFGAGEHPVDFAAHRQRRGEAGAREDFEQMLTDLVSAVTGKDAIPVRANPGDWGIDVLVGDLDGRVTIWQAKYFVNGFGESQQRQVRESFGSARKYAREKGYTIERWVLCVPCELDAPTVRWWQRWSRERRAETGVAIELWDAGGLRRRLALPEAATVRRSYYDPYRPAGPAGPAPVPPAPDGPAEVPWRGGEELCLGGDRYLLHDDAAETFAPDRSWVSREATADRVEPAAARVRLHRVAVLRDTPDAAGAREALRDRAALLSALAGARGLPRLLGLREEPGAAAVTLVTESPAGPRWREVFGPGGGPLDRFTAGSFDRFTGGSFDRFTGGSFDGFTAGSFDGLTAGPLDRLTVADVLAKAARLADALAELHRRGHSHRMLSPDTIVLTGRAYEPALRDAGLAAWPVRPGEGPEGYRAPEQVRAGPRLPPPGPHTDLHQLAAVVYHTVTGHPPLPGGSPPVRATVRGFPAAADELLARCLDADPRRRPGRAGALAAALREGRRELSRGEFS